MGAILAACIREQCVRVYFRLDRRWVGHEISAEAGASGPSGITAGPDGALWFTEYYAKKIGRISTAGVITEYPVPSGKSPAGITAEPDGALWFAEYRGYKIGRITTAGEITEYPVATTSDAGRFGIIEPNVVFAGLPEHAENGGTVA